jgi:putative sterol carrier protein
MVEGKVNAMAAVLRGEVSLEGDLGLVISFQRLFPGPPRTGAGDEH